MVEECKNIAPAQGEDPAARLCALLTEQIACARQGNMGQVECLGGQADSIIVAMGLSPADLLPMTEGQRNRLRRLYAELVLVLNAEQADVRTKLKQLQQVKRVVGVYNRKKQRR